jgi:4-hydroxy-tetrahydrodipicolinate reductase
MSEIKIILAGVGRVGKDVTRLLSARPGYRVVAAYSRNPKLAGRDLGTLASTRALGVAVTLDRDAALQQPADALVVATTSFLKDVATDLRLGIDRGLNVITTAEEAAFPWLIDESLANELDRLAKARQVSLLGVGLNPGFIFDALLLTATGVAWDVECIRVRRVVDVSRFSATIQRRLGIGFSRAKFEAGVKSGAISGHIGFPQSFSLTAKCLGRALDRIDKSLEPLLAEQVTVNEHVKVEIGQTAGFVQRSSGLVDGKPWISAEFIAHIAPTAVNLAPEDAISIEGYNSLNLTISPGCNPQRGSAAMIANCIPRVVEARPGFLTVADLAIPFARFTSRDVLKQS